MKIGVPQIPKLGQNGMPTKQIWPKKDVNIIVAIKSVSLSKRFIMLPEKHHKCDLLLKLRIISGYI